MPISGDIMLVPGLPKVSQAPPSTWTTAAPSSASEAPSSCCGPNVLSFGAACIALYVGTMVSGLADCKNRELFGLSRGRLSAA